MPGVKNASFAVESEESLGVTVGAANSKEAVLQPAALPSVFKLTLHMPRKRPLTRRQGFHKRRVVVFNE